jgi:pimeloyl-ACP methyl ester carboxylesterase
VLVLHGGPGLGYEYMDGIAAELGDGFTIASFQQRGLAPSTLEGPFTIAQAVTDVVAVLDALGWDRALVLGHSWGGHLALRFAAAHPSRLLGVLAIDAIGVVGDGGYQAFAAELMARTPAPNRERAQRLEAEPAGSADDRDALEALELVWPAYFADPAQTFSSRGIRITTATDPMSEEVTEGLEPVADALRGCELPIGMLAGTSSPIPWGQAANLTVELCPYGFLSLVETGHFPWIEQPGSVRAAVDRLAIG